MSNYTELKERAFAKGIFTFGDIARTAGVDPEDIWGDNDEVREMTHEYIFNCEAAIGGLESLAEVNLI